jgi:ferric-dicitrate binding protein FerR (iron transport regulator)
MSDIPNFSQESPFVAAITQLVSGDGSPEELARVEAWVVAEPQGLEWLELFRQATREIQPVTRELDLAGLQARVYRDIATRQRSERGQPFPGRLVGTISMFALLAGIFLLPVIRIGDTGEWASAGRMYATHDGQQATVTLADGSRALLGPATTLVVWENETRIGTTVKLTGQAIFMVSQRRQAPFTVHTTNAVARVLGTAFLVRQYGTEPLARIVVTEGRVSLHAASESNHSGVVLAAGSVGTVTDSGRIAILRDSAAEDYTAWTSGQLVFRKTPARDIVADLSRMYGAEIRLSDSTLARQTLTWTVSVRKITLDGALDALTGMLDAHTVQSGRVITIVPGSVTVRKIRNQPSPSTSESQYGR